MGTTPSPVCPTRRQWACHLVGSSRHRGPALLVAVPKSRAPAIPHHRICPSAPMADDWQSL